MEFPSLRYGNALKYDEMKSYKPIDDEAYKNHPVFPRLDEILNFYKMLSFSIFGFLTQGTRAICNIDSYLYSSVQGTIESIKEILKKGRINDAYALLRKYHDSSIINVYSNLYLCDNFSLENFIVEKIDNWLNGDEKLPEYRVMSQYIQKSEKFNELNKIIHKDDRYKEIRNRCNDHTHYNFYQNALFNDNEIYLKNRVEALNNFLHDIEHLFILHLAYIFHLNGHYMMASDYADYMDMGMTPPEGAQYYVAPFVQKVFDNFIKNKRPDLAEIIKSNTEMQLV